MTWEICIRFLRKLSKKDCNCDSPTLNLEPILQLSRLFNSGHQLPKFREPNLPNKKTAAAKSLSWQSLWTTSRISQSVKVRILTYTSCLWTVKPRNRLIMTLVNVRKWTRTRWKNYKKIFECTISTWGTQSQPMCRTLATRWWSTSSPLIWSIKVESPGKIKLNLWGRSNLNCLIPRITGRRHQLINNAFQIM